MAVTHDMYQQALLGIGDGSVDWKGGLVTAILLDDTYTPDLAAHGTLEDVSTHQIEDPDYAPVAVGNRDVVLNAGMVDFTSDDVSFGTEVSIAARYVVFVQGDAANLGSTDRLISVQDLGDMKSSTNSHFRLDMSGGYWFRLQLA